MVTKTRPNQRKPQRLNGTEMFSVAVGTMEVMEPALCEGARGVMWGVAAVKAFFMCHYLAIPVVRYAREPSQLVSGGRPFHLGGGGSSSTLITSHLGL